MNLPDEARSPDDEPPADHPTVILWNGFDPDIGHRARMPIFCGVPMQLMDDVMYIATARSRPAARLLARTPELMRNLSHRTTVKTERCVGHVRGPIQWSETITAWASGVGVNDVFVCGTPRRDFDVPENRLIVWLLKRLVSAGRRTAGDAAAWFDPDEIERVRLQGRTAQQLLSHPSLRGISSRKLDGREWRLVRKSRHLDTYGPAIKLADRVAKPFGANEARAIASAATQEHHRVMVMLLEAVRSRGYAVPQLTIRGDFLESGHLRYRNPYIMVDRRLSAESGLFFGSARVLTRADTVPEDARGTAVLVITPADAAGVVDAVLGEPLPAPVVAPVPTPPSAPSGAQSSASGFVQLPGSYSS